MIRAGMVQDTASSFRLHPSAFCVVRFRPGRGSYTPPGQAALVGSMIRELTVGPREG